MKATLFAVVLSCSVVSIPVYAVTKDITPSSGTKTTQSLKKINLNLADAKVLTRSFKGIGQKRAEAIVNYRNTHGSFKSIAELAAVRGFGKAFVDSHLTQLQTVFVVE